MKKSDNLPMGSRGIKAEKFFEEFCKSNKLDFQRVSHPFDYLVNGKLVEVKSAKLFTNQYKDGRKVPGRYQCWGKKQLNRMKKVNPWVCLIITNENGCLIQGFAKARSFPNTLRVSPILMEKTGVRSVKQFLRYVNG